MIPLDDLLNIRSEFGQNCNSVFLSFFFSIVPFHLVFVVASKIKLITFYCSHFEWPEHYSNIIMSAMVSQIISLTIVYWIVYSGADQRKHHSSASLAFVRGIHRWPVNSPHKGPVTRSVFPFDGVVVNILMYPEHLENLYLDFDHRLLIFLILATFRLCESGQICDFRAFSWEHNGEWPQIWHVGIFWPPSEQIRFWSRYVDIPHFWRYFDLMKQVKFGGSGIFFTTHGRNGLKFDMLMYPDHLWNWLHSGHGQLIFLILAPFLLSETCQMCSFQAFSWQCMGGIGWN